MKNCIIIICLLLVGNASAQKVIEKTFDHNDQDIYLDVKFARNIEVKTWDKSTVYFKALITVEEEQFIDQYEIDFKQSNNAISITEEAEDLFKEMREYGRKNDSNNSRYWYNSGDLCRFNYTLYVPKNTTINVSSINGHLKSELVEGNLSTDLINGNIEIKQYTGNLDLSTINGAIDLKISNTSVVAETIHGDIYAEEGLKFEHEDRHVGQKLWYKSSNSKNRLTLNTINGNMYLRN